MVVYRDGAGGGGGAGFVTVRRSASANSCRARLRLFCTCISYVLHMFATILSTVRQASKRESTTTNTL